MPKQTADEIRAASEKLMACKECGSMMLICQSGLVCEKGCGRIVDPYPWKLSELRRVWRNRTVEVA
jgi:hypothetical protein